MAFNNIGHFWMDAGAVTWAWVDLGGDRGAQWIQANPKPFDRFPTPSGVTEIESGPFRKRVLYANGGTQWTYHALIRNTGQLAGWVTLHGGGNA